MEKLNESSFIFITSPTKLANNSHLNKKPKTVSSGKASLRNYFSESYRNLLTTISISFVWMACTIIYFGMTIGITQATQSNFNTNNFIIFCQIGITSINESFNPYLMFFLSCLSEMLGYFIGLIGTQYPRRNLLTLYLGLAALSSLPVAFIQPGKPQLGISLNSILIILFASLGKML